MLYVKKSARREVFFISGFDFNHWGGHPPPSPGEKSLQKWYGAQDLDLGDDVIVSMVSN